MVKLYTPKLVIIRLLIDCQEKMSIWLNVLGALVSLLLLMLNLYTKNNNISEAIQQHKRASDLLWKIREEYISLLVDFDTLSIDEIMNKRDELQDRTSKIYFAFPKTDEKSYKEAQKALKYNEEQTFSELEIDIMLPNSIRRCNRNMKKDC